MAIVAVVVLYVAEMAVNALVPLPPPVWVLIRLAVGLVILLQALQCLGLITGPLMRLG